MLLLWDKDKGLKVVGTTILVPGLNEISDETWDGIKGQLEGELARQDLRTLTTEVGNKTVTSLLQWPIEQCRELVGACFSPQTLKNWERFETRETIRVMISTRMQELGVTPDKDQVLTKKQFVPQPMGM